MEKELTNEELLKALTYCCDGNGHCEHREDCPLRNESACTTVLARYSLELIHRQKAEIERLTEENGYLDGCAKQFLADYQKCEIERAEFQKQVDELKKTISIKVGYIDRVESEVVEWQFATKKAVKDKAKEILKWLKAKVIMMEIPHGSEPCEEDVEAVMWWQIKEHFKKEYGVEVE